MNNRQDEAKSRLGLTRYTVNPSVVNIQIDKRVKLKRVKQKDGEIAEWHNGITGEVLGKGAMLFTRQEVDATKFVKVYAAGIAAFAGLQPSGVKVLEIVINELKDNIDEIFINSKVIANAYNISIPTIKRGLKNLRERGILFDHFNGDGWFFINVNFLFKGDRYTVIQQFVIKSEKKIADHPDQLTMNFEE